MFIKRDLFSKELRFIASSLLIDYSRASTQSRATSDLAPNGLVLLETSALSSNIVKRFDKTLPSAHSSWQGWQRSCNFIGQKSLCCYVVYRMQNQVASQMRLRCLPSASAISFIMKKLCASHYRSTKEAMVHTLSAWTAKPIKPTYP